MNCILLLKSQQNFDELEMRATISPYFKYNPINDILRYTDSADDSDTENSESSECWDEILESNSFLSLYYFLLLVISFINSLRTK
jgi:hypothetical protein